MDQILLVEDADSLRDVLTSLLERAGYQVHPFSSAEDALPHIQSLPLDCIVADFRLPGLSGIEFLKEVRKTNESTPFLIMTAFGSIEIAVEAMKFGANDFITKPFEPEGFCSTVKQIINHKRIIERRSGIYSRNKRNLVTTDENVKQVLKEAKKVARVDTSVLILGESGTGKELIARYIHEQSDRREKPFIAVNCGAIPSELLESEFFGHEAGAFTGATQGRIGVLEHASEGTVFLDEVGEMPPSLQVKLLRSIQEREIKRVGGNKTIRINPRIISATNQDLEECMNDGRFRDDFYYRIAVVTLNLPPLRERVSDIDLLANVYLESVCEKIGKATLKLDDVTKDILRTYSWPGNARELENVIERAAILAEDVVLPEHLGISLPPLSFKEDGVSLTDISQRAAKEAEMELIKSTLNRTKGNKSQAAQILGVSYKTLLNKVKEYSIGSAE